MLFSFSSTGGFSLSSISILSDIISLLDTTSVIWTSSAISSFSSLSSVIELLSLVIYMFTIEVVSSGGVGWRLGSAGVCSAGAA